MVDIRLGIEQLASWLHNYDVHHQEGHKQRAKATLQRLYCFRQIAANPDLSPERVFAAQFAYLRKIEPLLFEEIVLEALKQRGFMVRFNERYSGDGGIDGRVWIDDWRTIDPFFRKTHPDRMVRGWAGVQCKRYEGPIRAEHLRQFPEDLARENLVAGFFVHTGTTPKIHQGAAGCAPGNGLEPPVKRISGKALLRLLMNQE